MLNPRIEELVGPEDAAVIVAELGTEMRLADPARVPPHGGHKFDAPLAFRSPPGVVVA